MNLILFIAVITQEQTVVGLLIVAVGALFGLYQKNLYNERNALKEVIATLKESATEKAAAAEKEKEYLQQLITEKELKNNALSEKYFDLASTIHPALLVFNDNMQSMTRVIAEQNKIHGRQKE